MTLFYLLKNQLLLVLPECTFREASGSLYVTDKSLVGEARIQDCGDSIFLHQLFIAKVDQRKGLGTKLLIAVELAGKHCRYKALECRPTTGGELHGIEFCVKHGFAQKGCTGILSKSF